MLCPYVVYSMFMQGLGVSLFIFSLANNAAGVPTVITHPELNHDIVSSAGLPYCNTMSGEEDLIKQVEDLEKKKRGAEEKKRLAEEEKEEMRRGREEARGRVYMTRGLGAGGLASRAMGSAVHMDPFND